MNDRQKSIFNLIIREYIKSAEPISSALVVGRGEFDLSPATIRNEMAELEEQGYIYQPYTSAGRVPTEKGYHFYVDNLLEPKKLNKKEESDLKASVKQRTGDEKETVKNLAKTLAELSAETVLIGFSPNNFYYTGLTNLFSQPEFARQDLVRNLSLVIDNFDEVMPEIFDLLSREAKILIGEDNPFAEDCGLIVSEYRSSRVSSGLLGIIGPMRMNYETNLSLVEYAKQLLARE